jgi:hypothetical protein
VNSEQRHPSTKLSGELGLESESARALRAGSPRPGRDGIWLGDTGDLLNATYVKGALANGLLLYVRKREIVETGAAPFREPLPDWTPFDGQARNVRRCRRRSEQLLLQTPCHLILQTDRKELARSLTVSGCHRALRDGP